MLELIEEGDAWPTNTNVGRFAFMSKDNSKLDDALAYRLLLILSVLYRRWATVRLRNLKEWIATWAQDGFFAGTDAVGAEDAWWETAVVIEEMLLNDTPFSAGTADLFKCFDQIPRELIYMLALHLGLDPKILFAYRRFQENLQMRNAIAGGLGKQFMKPCGIPQRCPLSMMFIALIMLPWLKTVKANGATQDFSGRHFDHGYWD